MGEFSEDACRDLLERAVRRAGGDPGLLAVSVTETLQPELRYGKATVKDSHERPVWTWRAFFPRRVAPGDRLGIGELRAGSCEEILKAMLFDGAAAVVDTPDLASARSDAETRFQCWMDEFRRFCAAEARKGNMQARRAELQARFKEFADRRQAEADEMKAAERRSTLTFVPRAFGSAEEFALWLAAEGA